MGLLSLMGRDCPEAVSFLGVGEDPVPRASDYVEVDEGVLGLRLSELMDRGEASWQARAEHWSLGGGFQPKIALACFDGRWYSCEGDAATTHILKPGIKGRAFQSLVEHVTMRACALMGVEVANTEYLDGLGAVCIERFDRVVRRPFDVVRIHQEDFCQACGILPENKYTENGGPVAPDIAAAIDRFIDDPDTDKKAFFLMVVANHLLGAPDGHAKNFSLLEYPDGGVRLAPMYDCASGLPYDGPRDRRVAMGIGGVSAVGRLGIGAVARMAKACDLNGDWCAAKVGRPLEGASRCRRNGPERGLRRERGRGASHPPLGPGRIRVRGHTGETSLGPAPMCNILHNRVSYADNLHDSQEWWPKVPPCGQERRVCRSELGPLSVSHPAGGRP